MGEGGDRGGFVDAMMLLELLRFRPRPALRRLEAQLGRT